MIFLLTLVRESKITVYIFKYFNPPPFPLLFVYQSMQKINISDKRDQLHVHTWH